MEDLPVDQTDETDFEVKLPVVRVGEWVLVSYDTIEYAGIITHVDGGRFKVSNILFYFRWFLLII